MSVIRKVDIDNPMSEGDISVNLGCFDRSQRFRVSEDVIVPPVLITKIIAIFNAMQHVWSVDIEAVLTVDTTD